MNGEKSWAFQSLYLGPEGTGYGGDMSQFAINAMAIARRCSWREAYDLLLRQAHELCLMPCDEKCVKAMFQEGGFFQQPSPKEDYSIEDVCRYMNAHCHEGQIALLQMSWGGLLVVTAEDLSALGVKGSPLSRYQCLGCRCLSSRRVKNIWVRWEDAQDHSPVRRRKSGSRAKKESAIPADHEAFHYYMENPAGKYTIDCSLRALASSCGFDWHEALDRLAQAAEYRTTTISTDSIIEKVLLKEGFTRYPVLKVNGRPMTGREFCREMDRRYRHGEKIFAKVGPRHVAAVLPITESGVTRYKIVDNWDSTCRRIWHYYVKSPAREPVITRSPRAAVDPQAALVTGLETGTRLLHPMFGQGTVQQLSSAGTLEVRFDDGQVKVLTVGWVQKNCRQCA